MFDGDLDIIFIRRGCPGVMLSKERVKRCFTKYPPGKCDDNHGGYLFVTNIIYFPDLAISSLIVGQHKMESRARLAGPGQFVLKAVKANWFVMVLYGYGGR